MRTLDRYIFRQLLAPVLGAVAALTAIALLSQSLAQFDLIVERGQSAWTFLKVTLYSLPQLAGLIFPIALFVGTLVAVVRLQGEHEFVACYAAGQSLAKVVSPILRIGVYFTLISLASNLFLQPIANRAFREETFRIKNDVISALIKEGDFSTSQSGLTIYVQRIDQNGLLREIFIREPSPDGHDHTYSAKEGRVTKIDGLSYIVMRHGSDQQVSDKGVLTSGTWDETSFDITSYFSNDDYLSFKEGDRYMHELFWPNLSLPGIGSDWDRAHWQKLFAEAHARLSAPLYNIAFMLLAMLSVMGGRFSRNGYVSRIAIAGAVAGGIRILGVVITTACNHAVFLNFLQYVVPIVPIVICLMMIRKADKTTRTSRSQRSQGMTPLHAMS